MSRFAAVCCATFMFIASCGVPVDSDSESNENEPSGGSAAIGDGDAASGGDHSGTGASTGDGGALVGTGGSGAGGTEPSGTGGAVETGGVGATGGAAGTGGSDGIGGAGITSCQPAFETACKPNISFDNQHSDGGGALFDDLFPDIVSEMQDITCTVCSILYRNPDEIPQNKRHSTVNVTIDAHNGVAYASGNSITMSVNHLSNYTNPASAYVEYRGVLVHETVHLYQHYGNGGTGEGMADCVRIRVGLYQPGRCNTGGSWQDAYTTSGCFYSWLTGPSVYHSFAHSSFDPDMPYKINAALSGTSGEGAYTAVSSLLETTFGQDVDALWDAYQDDL